MTLIHYGSLKEFNTFSIDAVSEYVFFYNQASHLQEIKSLVQQNQLPLRVLGGGSNVILSDFFPGITVVMQNKGYTVIFEDDNHVVIEVQSGEVWHEFVEWSLNHGYYGIENLALIPGTVGAAPIQNIGAYGVEVEQFIHSVKGSFIDNDTEKSLEIPAKDCEFAYRYSIFKTKPYKSFLISSVVFKLSKRESPNIRYQALQQHSKLQNEYPTAVAVFEAVCEIRQSKLPCVKKLPNVGSFFKNPVIQKEEMLELKERFSNLVVFPYETDNKEVLTYKLAAAWMIDYCGWKGFNGDKVSVSDKQALVLINHSGTSKDISLFAHKIQVSVFQTFHIWLEIEPIQM